MPRARPSLDERAARRGSRGRHRHRHQRGRRVRRAPRAVRGGARCACAVRGRSPAERRTHSQCARTAAWARAHKVRVYIRIHSGARVPGARAKRRGEAALHASRPSSASRSAAFRRAARRSRPRVPPAVRRPPPARPAAARVLLPVRRCTALPASRIPRPASRGLGARRLWACPFGRALLLLSA